MIWYDIFNKFVQNWVALTVHLNTTFHRCTHKPSYLFDNLTRTLGSPSKSGLVTLYMNNALIGEKFINWNNFISIFATLSSILDPQFYFSMLCDAPTQFAPPINKVQGVPKKRGISECYSVCSNEHLVLNWEQD